MNNDSTTIGHIANLNQKEKDVSDEVIEAIYRIMRRNQVPLENGWTKSWLHEHIAQAIAENRNVKMTYENRKPGDSVCFDLNEQQTNINGTVIGYKDGWLKIEDQEGNVYDVDPGDVYDDF